MKITIELTQDVERAYLTTKPERAEGISDLLNCHAFEGNLDKGEYEPVLLAKTGLQAAAPFLTDWTGAVWYIADPSLR